MIARIILLLVVPVLAYISLRSVKQRLSLSPAQFNLLFIATVALMVVVILIVLGRLPVQFIIAPLGVIATVFLRALPTLLRLLPLWHMFKSRTVSGKRNSAGQSSTIRTEYLAMNLQHHTGDMDGLVLKGEFKDQQLSALTQEQLLYLLSQCYGDGDSRQVLEAYLDRVHPHWRELVDQQQGTTETLESVMTRELALEMLGLTDPISKEEVIKAHRSLMQKLHPDRGGTDYFAKKINEAKDFLLQNL